jgi:K+-transporting ATPase A subunit
MLFLAQAGIKFFRAFGTKAVREFYVRVLRKIVLYILPVFLIIPYFLTTRAYGENASQFKQFGNIFEHNQNV